MHSHVFTVKYSGLSRVITFPVKIALRDAEGVYETRGIIDTGANGSVISDNIATRLKALPQTFVKVHTASEQNVITPMYEADIEIGGKVQLSGLMVTSGALIAGEAEFLVGMDILNQGDLAVTNFDGKTSASFRIPSAGQIDFLEETPDKITLTREERRMIERYRTKRH